ncbi:unnamed protein product, partial [Candidula unifasciata]
NWEDEFLQWNSSDYGGVEEVTVTQGTVWLPDLLLENTFFFRFPTGLRTLLKSAVTQSWCTSDTPATSPWEPGIFTKTICEVNIGKYPFDYQRCEIKFLTWMHTNKTLDVQPDTDFINLNATIDNGEWDIISAVARPYYYPSTYSIGTAHTGVRFIVELMRKRTFYVLNTIIPVMMLSLLNVLVFLLPASSGEKMALAVTVLLSFTVYLSIISEVMPKTSESISILAVYLTTLLSLSTLSVLSSGVVMNLFHHETDKPVPNFLKCLLHYKLQEIRRQVRSRNILKPCPCSQENRHGYESSRSPQNETFSENGHHYSNSTFSRSNKYSNYDYTFIEPKMERDRSHRQGQHVKTMTSRSNMTRKYHELSRVKSMFLKLSPEFVDANAEEWELVTWKDVGSAVDTVLFWVFLGFTLASTMIALIMFSAH